MVFPIEIKIYKVGWMVSRPVYTGSDQRELPPPDDALVFCSLMGFRWNDRMYCWTNDKHNRLNVRLRRIRVTAK